VQLLSGPLTLDLRFPGQWFQLEAGLHYNWHRHYDPSLGRYTQPDPLGFVDGPSVYGYAQGRPITSIDPKGLQSSLITKIPGITTLCTLGLAEPTPLGEIACGCAIAAIWLWASKPDACENNSCMAKPPGYWNGPEGAGEWGRRNNVPPREAKNKFHEIKQHDPGSRGDDYYVNPDTGDVIGPSGESAGNLGD